MKQHNDSESPSISRRGFVWGAGGAATLLALGAVGYAWADNTSAIRPPGAQWTKFNSLCIRCDRCRQACPTGVIGVGKLEEGLDSVRVPRMEFRQGYCDTCDGAYRCVAVCPTGALRSFNPMKEKIALAQIDIGKCETYGVSASCGRVCQDACPAQALLSDEEGRVYVDEAACWGCGECEYVCPANAYRTYDGSVSRGVNVVSLKEAGYE